MENKNLVVYCPACKEYLNDVAGNGLYTLVGANNKAALHYEVTEHRAIIGTQAEGE